MLTSIARVATRRSASTIFSWSPRLSLSPNSAPSTLQRFQIACAPSHAVRAYAIPASAQRREKRQTDPSKKTISGTSQRTRKPAKSLGEPKPRGRPSKSGSGRSLAAKSLDEKKNLKATALLLKDTEPKGLTSSAWPLFISEKWTGTTFDGATTELKSLASAWANLSPREVEHYKTKARDNKLANAASYKAWVESHTVPDIAKANKARKTLKTKFNYPKKPSVPKLIKDDRMPKRNITPYAYFTKARFSNGDLTGHITENVGMISQEWKSMSEAQKQPYIDLAKADSHRYEKELAAAGLSESN